MAVLVLVAAAVVATLQATQKAAPAVDEATLKPAFADFDVTEVADLLVCVAAAVAVCPLLEVACNAV